MTREQFWAEFEREASEMDAAEAAELRREIQQHLDSEIRARIEMGDSRETAEEIAYRRFGRPKIAVHDRVRQVAVPIAAGWFIYAAWLTQMAYGGRSMSLPLPVMTLLLLATISQPLVIGFLARQVLWRAVGMGALAYVVARAFWEVVIPLDATFSLNHMSRMQRMLFQDLPDAAKVFVALMVIGVGAGRGVKWARSQLRRGPWTQ